MNHWDWEQIGIGCIIVGVIGLFAVCCWWRYQHPCLEYQPRWVEQWTELRTIHHDCGKDCDFTTIQLIDHPAHWTNVCTKYGDREEGDREAPVPPLPVEAPYPPR